MEGLFRIGALYLSDGIGLLRMEVENGLNKARKARVNSLCA